MARRTVDVYDRIAKAMRELDRFNDGALGNFAEDATELSRSLLGDLVVRQASHDSTVAQASGRGYVRKSTNSLQQSIRPVRKGFMAYAIETDAQNAKGHGYGAAQEYGWHPHGKGEKKKGRFFIIRGTMGMVSRWLRGGRWESGMPLSSSAPRGPAQRDNKGRFVKGGG